MALVGSTLERWNTPCVSAFQFRRLKIKLKIYSRPFAICTIFKTPQSKREMHAPMPRGGRRPTCFTPLFLVLLACSTSYITTSYMLVTRLLQVRTVTFSRDSSQNGSLCGRQVRIWIGGDRGLHCAEECSHLFQNIILLSREQSLTSDSLYL